MARYLARKLGGAAFSLLMVLFSAFFLFRLLGGDPVQNMTRDSAATPEQKAALRHDLGLDRPLYEQFLRYITDTLSGDLGKSFEYDQPVTELISERLWPTVLLTGSALILAVTLGLWIGTRAGWRQGSRFDRTQVALTLGLWSAPTFWLGLIMMMVFSVALPLFPTGNMIDSRTPPGALNHVLDVAHHLVLPVLTMTAVVYAQYLLVMRSSVLDELGNDYLITARAKGLRDDLVRRRHAVPNALLPTVTLVFQHLGGVIGGAITVETVFSWPGLGYLAFAALRAPDLPVLQGTFLIFSGAVIIANTLADIIYRFLDPRVRAA